MASRYWVGGSGTWDATTTTNWAATSGGAGGVSVPTSADTVTFDASSGSPAVTLAANAAVSTFTSSSAGLTLSLGTYTITVSGTGNAWNVSAGTFNVGTSSIVLTGAGATFIGGSKTYYAVSLTGSGTMQINGTNTFTNLTRTGTATQTDALTLTASQTITGTLTLNSNSVINRLLVGSATLGTQYTLTAAALVCTNVINFIDVIGAGAATWTTTASGATYFGDAGGTSGITTTTSATQTWSGTSGGNWSANAWTSRVPLPQDDVVISSAFSASQTISNDAPRLGRSISFVGTTGNPIWAFSTTTNYVYGSITLVSGMTISGTQQIRYSGRGSYTTTTAGVSFTNPMSLYAPGGTYTMQDNYTTAGLFDFNTGAWVLNGFLLSISVLTSNVSSTRSMTSGTGGGINITQTSTSNVWTVGGSNYTFNFTGGSVNLTTASANTRTFITGGSSLGNFNYTVNGSTGTLVMNGGSTFKDFNFTDTTNARTLQFAAGTTTTITGNFNVTGTSGKLMSIQSSTAATHTLAKSGGTVSTDYVSITNSIAGGGALWYAGANSTNVSGNSGWNFTIPPAIPAAGFFQMF